MTRSQKGGRAPGRPAPVPPRRWHAPKGGIADCVPHRKRRPTRVAMSGARGERLAGCGLADDSRTDEVGGSSVTRLCACSWTSLSRSRAPRSTACPAHVGLRARASMGGPVVGEDLAEITQATFLGASSRKPCPSRSRASGCSRAICVRESSHIRVANGSGASVRTQFPASSFKSRRCSRHFADAALWLLRIFQSTWRLTPRAWALIARCSRSAQGFRALFARGLGTGGRGDAVTHVTGNSKQRCHQY